MTQRNLSGDGEGLPSLGQPDDQLVRKGCFDLNSGCKNISPGNERVDVAQDDGNRSGAADVEMKSEKAIMFCRILLILCEQKS